MIVKRRLGSHKRSCGE